MLNYCMTFFLGPMLTVVLRQYIHVESASAAAPSASNSTFQGAWVLVSWQLGIRCVFDFHVMSLTSSILFGACVLPSGAFTQGE